MPAYYVFRTSRSNSIRSIRSLRNLRRVRRILNENEQLLNKQEDASQRGHRTPVIILNQVQEPSLFASLLRHKFLCAGTTIYTILWAILFICCIIQCMYRVNQYLFYPTATVVEFEQNETLTPPCVTICSSDMKYNRNPVIWGPHLTDRVGNINYTDAYDLLTKTNITIDELWDMSRFALKDLRYYVVQGNLWSGFRHYNTVSEEDFFTVNGVCSTFKTSEMLPCIGMISGIKISSSENKDTANNPFNSYSITFHTEDEMPEVRYFGTLGTGVHLPFRQHVNTALKLRKVTFEDTWAEHCDTRIGEAKCIGECLERHIIESSNLTIPCRLPYMEQTSSLPPCVTPEEFLDIYTATENAIREVHIDSECDCTPPCEEIVYTADYFFREPTTELFDIFVNFPDCKVEIIAQEISYGFTNLLSDIGGALGLFLGISLISVYDLTAKMIQRKRDGKKCCC